MRSAKAPYPMYRMLGTVGITPLVARLLSWLRFNAWGRTYPPFRVTFLHFP
jgi:hypothetical protein